MATKRRDKRPRTDPDVIIVDNGTKGRRKTPAVHVRYPGVGTSNGAIHDPGREPVWYRESGTPSQVNFCKARSWQVVLGNPAGLTWTAGPIDLSGAFVPTSADEVTCDGAMTSIEVKVNGKTVLGHPVSDGFRFEIWYMPKGYCKKHSPCL